MLYGSSVVGRHPAAPAARHRQDDHGGLFCAGPGRDPPFPCVSLGPFHSRPLTLLVPSVNAGLAGHRRT